MEIFNQVFPNQNWFVVHRLHSWLDTVQTKWNSSKVMCSGWQLSCVSETAGQTKLKGARRHGWGRGREVDLICSDVGDTSSQCNTVIMFLGMSYVSYRTLAWFCQWQTPLRCLPQHKKGSSKKKCDGHGCAHPKDKIERTQVLLISVDVPRAVLFLCYFTV